VLAGFWLGWTGWSISLALASSWEEAQWGLALNVLWIVGVAVVYLLWRDRPAGSSARGHHGGEPEVEPQPGGLGP
jgi:hypothetical protein